MEIHVAAGKRHKAIHTNLSHVALQGEVESNASYDGKAGIAVDFGLPCTNIPDGHYVPLCPSNGRCIFHL